MQSLLMIYEVKENYNKHLYFHSVQLIFFLHTFNIYYICTIYTSEPAWLQYNYEHCTQHRTCTIFLFSGLYHKKIMYMRQQVKSSTLYSLTALTKPPIICDHERGVASYYLEVGYRLHLKMKMLC